MKIWLDESRPAPKGWKQCKTVEEAILASHYTPDAVSLDHDLSFAAIFELAPSGLSYARWLVQTNRRPKYIEIHSQNPLAAYRMKRVFAKAGMKSVWKPYGYPFVKNASYR